VGYPKLAAITANNRIEVTMQLELWMILLLGRAAEPSISSIIETH